MTKTRKAPSALKPKRRALIRYAIAAAAILFASPSTAGGNPFSGDSIGYELTGAIGNAAARVAHNARVILYGHPSSRALRIAGAGAPLATTSTALATTGAVKIRSKDKDDRAALVALGIGAIGIAALVSRGSSRDRAPGWGSDGEFRSGESHYRSASEMGWRN